MRKFQLGLLRNLPKVTQLVKSIAGTRTQVWAYLCVFLYVSLSVYMFISVFLYVRLLLS